MKILFFLRKFIVMMITAFLYYLVFYMIFFLFLGSLSVDGLIGFSMFVLFYLIYRQGGTRINRFFLSISRNVWMHFASLIFITYLVKNLFFRTVKSLKKISTILIICNYFVFYEIGRVFNELNCNLLSKLITNSVELELYYKNLVINSLIEKNKLPVEILIFTADFINTNLFFFYNTIGWIE